MHFVVRNEASFRNRFVFDFDHVGAGAEDLRTWKLDSVLLQISAAAGARADLVARSAVIAHPLVIVPVEPLVAPVAPLKLLVVHVAGKCHASDHEVIAAEHFADSFDHVRVESADGSPDGDD